MRDLSGVPINYLSMAESGRVIPTAAEYEAVTKALARLRGEIA